MSSVRYEAGEYPNCVIKSQCLDKSGNDDKPVIVFEIDPFGDGVIRRIYRYLTLNAIKWTIKDLVALGYPYDTFDQIQLDHPDAFDMTGKTVSCVCIHEEYDGKTREKWSFTSPEYAPANFERKEVAQLNAQFKDLWKKYRPAPATTVIASPVIVNNQPAEDPIPF
jgi:hypothetical protein